MPWFGADNWSFLSCPLRKASMSRSSSLNYPAGCQNAHRLQKCAQPCAEELNAMTILLSRQFP